eukprot:TRINITY_DN1592_c0_g2_i1.p1 TRINITY_DN1592_c0_g2~~TRINITY_DN1592_c0_g2_i1.p1  ORF type:complete len:337 (+),score=77.95 TRINITY_DN1592_c0_g2_i1:69-1013(+)
MTTEETFEQAAQGLKLAGGALQPPKILNPGWQQGHIFTARDDPDRTSMPWKAPEFVRAVDPAEQAARTSVEEIDCCGNGERGSFARIVRGVLTEDQCAALIHAVNEKGFTPALLNIGGGRQVLSPGHRDGHRVIVDSPELTKWLMQVLRPHIPETLGGAHAVELNERCRFLCYTPGQSFPAHFDGRYSRPYDHPRRGDYSQVTVQLYLHDVSPGAGGATTLFPGSRDATPCQPSAGSVLLFTQDLFHEGSLVKEGLKYTLRTEVMYTTKPTDAGDRADGRKAPAAASDDWSCTSNQSQASPREEVESPSAEPTS